MVRNEIMCYLIDSPTKSSDLIRKSSEKSSTNYREHFELSTTSKVLNYNTLIGFCDKVSLTTSVTRTFNQSSLY